MASKKNNGSKKKSAKKGGPKKLSLHKETVKDMKVITDSAAKDRQSIHVCVV